MTNRRLLFDRVSQCRCLAFLVLAFTLVGAALASPTVSNVRAAQRPGTNFIDITYDLAITGATSASVEVKASRDGGGTFEAVPSDALLPGGAFGSAQLAGTNKTLVWRASGQGWAAALYPTVQVEVTAIVSSAPAGFALIPPGAFQMGDSFGDEGYGSEQPVHAVTLSAFYIETTETTKAKWDEVRTWGATRGYTDLYVGAGKAANHPVQDVSWHDIVKWCNAASERDGLVPVYRTFMGEVHRTGTATPWINYANNGYRLPSEAEWEKAARGGQSGKRFPWGDTITHSHANYWSETGVSYDVSPTRGPHPIYASMNFPNTSPVGSFGANGYGLNDMAGNVSEFCNDWIGSYSYASSPISDPRGPSLGSLRVKRGGDWLIDSRACRVAARSIGSPDSRFYSVGFRLARSL